MNSFWLYTLILATTVLDQFHIVLASQVLVWEETSSKLMALITGRFSSCAFESCRWNLHILCAALPCLITKASFTGRISTFLCKVFLIGTLWEKTDEERKMENFFPMTPKWFSCSYLKTHLLKGDQHFPISPPQVRLQAVFSRH